MVAGRIGEPGGEGRVNGLGATSVLNLHVNLCMFIPVSVCPLYFNKSKTSIKELCRKKINKKIEEEEKKRKKKRKARRVEGLVGVEQRMRGDMNERLMKWKSLHISSSPSEGEKQKDKDIVERTDARRQIWS